MPPRRHDADAPTGRRYCYDATRRRFHVSEANDVRCETFVFLRDASKPGFDTDAEWGEEGRFFNGRVPHDVYDDEGIFVKIHHARNASSTPVTDDVAADRAPRALVDLVRRHAPLYAGGDGDDLVSRVRLDYAV